MDQLTVDSGNMYDEYILYFERGVRGGRSNIDVYYSKFLDISTPFKLELELFDLTFQLFVFNLQLFILFLQPLTC